MMPLSRCILSGYPSEGVSCSLHGSCDASKHAYAAIVYPFLKSPTGQTARFIASKIRVHIPASTGQANEECCHKHGNRIAVGVTYTCYTDSEVSLYWICGVDRVWKQFVQHCGLKIGNPLPSACWHHCVGVNDPDDLPSRGVKPADLAKNELWVTGPQ